MSSRDASRPPLSPAGDRIVRPLRPTPQSGATRRRQVLARHLPSDGRSWSAKMQIRLLALAVLLLLPASAAAEDPAPGGAAGAQRSPSPDFLFAPPKGSVSFRWTVNMPRANSDWFGFVREQLTLDRGDFTA